MSQEIPDKLIVLTFDDAARNHRTFVAPLLQKLHFGATFFISELDGFDDDKRQFMSWEEIQQLHQMGFEIGNHTGHHPAIQRLPQERLVEEIEYIERKCAAYGISQPVTFCYPGGGASQEALPLLRRKSYRLARITGNRAFVLGMDDPLLIPSFVIQGTDEPLFYDAIEQARDRKIVVLTFHGIPDLKHSWVTTDPGLFTGYMTHLLENGYTVIAFRDLEIYRPLMTETSEYNDSN
jgi:peptidoglycan-N-acetylglucosamine deacetylase